MTLLKYASRNLVLLIDECLKNQNLSKLIVYNDNNPLNKPQVDISTIAPHGSNERYFAYPFDINFKDEKRTQIHIYYPNIKFKNNQNVADNNIYFDIVVHKKIWLYAQSNEKLVRPYQIASLIMDTFDKSTDTLGVVNFHHVAHVVVNEEFDAIRLVASTKNW